MQPAAQELWDAVVIGGGAAGFFAAITCASELPGARVLLLEKSKHLLSKVKVSGGGRCNVTHHCFEPKQMATNYPRGGKALIGPLHRFGVSETIQWFRQRGLVLKTEDDGRMFPSTDDSQTVIDCLMDAAESYSIHIKTLAGVKAIRAVGLEAGASAPSCFELQLDHGAPLNARKVLVATGGSRSSGGGQLAQMLGHTLKEAVPSLFSFNSADRRIQSLPGVAVDSTEVRINGTSLKTSGPLLITHRGMSGPAILKLSAWGARELHALDYRFILSVNWLPNDNVAHAFDAMRQAAGSRQVFSRSPFAAIPKRLWQSLTQAAGVAPSCTWSELPRSPCRALMEQLTAGQFAVSGKSTNKDEFVTCGGVPTNDVDMRTMESRRTPGAYFAGEILDIDGVTGGFNFQNAWTTGYLAGTAMAQAIAGER